MGFPPRFCNTIKSLSTDAETVVIINGEISSPFIVMCGVRQGDPLSCLLFNLAIEPLACLIQNSELKGVKIPGKEDNLIISLFADDTTDRPRMNWKPSEESYAFGVQPPPQNLMSIKQSYLVCSLAWRSRLLHKHRSLNFPQRFATLPTLSL
jgi:hypothetical protein